MKSLALLLATSIAATVACASAPPATAASTHQDKGAVNTATAYVCPMHPEVTSPTPGTCPKCNMKLVVKE
jgi:hypothetical protein